MASGKKVDLEKLGENLLNRRTFTVQSMKNSEALTLSIKDLDRMRKDFLSATRSLFKIMI